MAVELGSPGAGRSCDECGGVNPPSARFCGECGHRLRGPDDDHTTGAGQHGADPGPSRAVPPTEPARGPTPGATPRVTRRRVVWAVVAILAVVAAGVTVSQRGPELGDEVAGSDRGDAGNRGVYAPLPSPGLPQDVAWRDTWTSSPPDRQAVPRRPVAVGLGYLVATTGGVAMLDRTNGHVRWRVELSVSGVVEPLPLDDRTIVVAGTDEVSRLDAVDGVRAWRAGLPGLGEAQAVAATRDTLAVAGSDGTVWLLDADDASLRSRVGVTDLGLDPTSTVTGLVVAAGRFIAVVRPVGGEDGRLAAIDVDGSVAWVAPEPVTASLPLAGGATGSVIVGHAGQGVLGLDVETGAVRWRWEPSADAGPQDLAAVAVTPDGSRVLLVSPTGTRRTLGTAFGNVVAVADGAPLPVGYVGPVDAGGRVAAITPSGEVEVVDVGSGGTVATGSTVGPGASLPLVDGDRVVVGYTGGRVVAQPIGPTGSSWRAVVSPAASCAATGAGAAVLVADAGTLRTHEAGSGRRRWEARPEGDTGVGPAAAGGELVVTATPTGSVVALGVEDGERRWAAEAGGVPVGAPLVVDGTVVLVGRTGEETGDGGTVSAWSLQEGILRWTADLGAAPSAPASVADGRVVGVTDDGELVALDLATGGERWRTDLRHPAVSAPVLAGAAIVVVDHRGLSTWVDDGDDVRRVARTDLAVPLGRVPAVIGDVIVVRGDSTRLVALDLTTHAVRWEAVTTSDVLTTPPTVVGDLVLVGGQTGVHAFALADGAAVARAEVGPLVGTISATRDGVVVCRVDGTLLVLR